jgi:hypothetical protein
MTRLQRRVEKLERTELLKCHLSPLERLQRALDEAAVRLTGRDLSFVQGDEPTTELVANDLQDSFMKDLSDVDLANLISALEPIAFGGNTAALEAARQDAVRELVP